jgi:hypothetical protein
MRAEYEEDLQAFDVRQFWRNHDKNFKLVGAQARLSEARASSKRKRVSRTASNEGDVAIKKRKRVKGEDVEAKDEKTPSTATESPGPEASEATIFDNPFQGSVSGKQNEESPAEFIKRVPPSTSTPTDLKDAWIWVANPKVKHTYDAKIANFKEAGFAVLKDLGRQRAQLESENPTKAASSITRMMKPYREGAQAQLAQLAKANNVTSGKWLLFPSADDVDRVWKTVVEGTWDGRLGMSAKVAPNDPFSNEKNERVICIYTDDFANSADVKFVLSSMRDLGLVEDSSTGKAVYYKCDFVTHLDLMSGNEYKLPTTMYNSRDMFRETVDGKRRRS